MTRRPINYTRAPGEPHPEARFFRPQRYAPKVGSVLTVHLPGEVMRCKVDQIVDENAVIIEINSIPMAKSHFFRQGDKVGARRRVKDGREYWEAMSDRDFLATAPGPPKQEAPKRKKKAA